MTFEFLKNVSKIQLRFLIGKQLTPANLIFCPFLFQYAFWIPGLTIALKLPLIIPPIDWYLTKIRGGWTRNQKSSDSTEIFGMDNLGMDQSKIKGYGSIDKMELIKVN